MGAGQKLGHPLAGVIHSSVWRGRPLSWAATRSNVAWSRCSGSLTICSAILAVTVSMPASLARWVSITYRVWRSTSVPINDRPPLPTIRSLSQCPGTARSSASAGRCEIEIMAGVRPSPVGSRLGFRPERSVRR